jgi:prepilin-type N-terminal cleavage/methylation domain-containing protein
MHRGYTLIEMAVVFAILGIIAGLGWSNMSNFFPRFHTNQAATSLKTDLMVLRKMAVESNRETRLRFISHGGSCSASSVGGGSWEMSIGDKSIGSTSWDLLPEDTVEDNVDDDQALALRTINRNSNSSATNVCLENWGAIQGPAINSANNKDAIVFSPRGWLRNPSGDFSQNGFIEIVLHNLEALRGQLVHKVTVQIASSGMVRIYSYETDYNQNQVGVSTSSSAQ